MGLGYLGAVSGSRAILWDFDGTLAERPGRWRACLCEVLDRYEPGHRVAAEALIPFLKDGFPWHTPHVAHPQLSTADAWWQHLRGLLERAFAGVGFSVERASELAAHVRDCYPDPARWRVFDDVVPVLTALRGSGWRHVIVSNHVPELADLVDRLGLGMLIEATVNSAVTGFEKPHPEMFKLGRVAAGNPEEIWMVGDNPHADVAGAEAVGIPAILVRRAVDKPPTITRQAQDLTGVHRYL